VLKSSTINDFGNALGLCMNRKKSILTLTGELKMNLEMNLEMYLKRGLKIDLKTEIERAKEHLKYHPQEITTRCWQAEAILALVAQRDKLVTALESLIIQEDWENENIPQDSPIGKAIAILLEVKESCDG
jgi:shikimate kinase